jgi:phosphopantetheinyl transferase
LGELHLWRLPASPLALKQVLAVYLGRKPEQIRLQEGEHGKPRLADPEQRLRFNLSHSGGLALVAVSGELEVGVDLERLRPKREEAHYWRWACREAHVKCLGTGLLQAREAPLEPAAVKPIEIQGFAAAVAVAGSEMLPLQGFEIGRPLPEDGERVS